MAPSMFLPDNVPADSSIPHPPGWYVEHPGRDYRPAIRGVTIAFFVVSVLVVALRFYCRIVLVKRFGWDDRCMLIALLWLCAVLGLNLGQMEVGSGQGLDTWNYAHFPMLLRLWYVYQMAYVLLLFFIKASILNFLHALSRSRKYRIGIYVFFGIVTAYTLAILFLSAFQCSPISNAFNPINFGKNCLYLPTFYYLQSSFNLLSDTFLLLYPLPTLFRLSLPPRKKYALIAIFSVGSITIVASILRFIAIAEYADPRNDTNIYSGLIILWSAVEANVGILTASAPMLQPLVKAALEGIAISRGRYGHTTATDGGHTGNYNGGGAGGGGGRRSHRSYFSSLRNTSRTHGIAQLSSISTSKSIHSHLDHEHDHEPSYPGAVETKISIGPPSRDRRSSNINIRSTSQEEFMRIVGNGYGGGGGGREGERGILKRTEVEVSYEMEGMGGVPNGGRGREGSLRNEGYGGR